jgi:hypothetical protein
MIYDFQCHAFQFPERFQFTNIWLYCQPLVALFISYGIPLFIASRIHLQGIQKKIMQML